MRLDDAPVAVRMPIEGVQLDAARPDDADAILAIYTACGFETRTAEGMRAVLEGDRHAHAVARHGGKVVAFAEIETHWPERPWVAYVGVDALLLNKLDGTARGGAVVALVTELSLPIALVGVGEKIDDWSEFDPRSFARGLVAEAGSPAA